MKAAEREQLKRLLEALLRPQRACSIGMYLLLLELRSDGELSSLALERRLKQAGLKNPRQYVHGAASAGWVRCCEHEDGKCWVLTGAGHELVTGLMRRVQSVRSVRRTVELDVEGEVQQLLLKLE